MAGSHQPCPLCWEARAMEEATLVEVDEAISHVRSSLHLAIAAGDEQMQVRHRARLDQLLDARSVLTHDMAMSCSPVFSG